MFRIFEQIDIEIQKTIFGSTSPIGLSCPMPRSPEMLLSDAFPSEAVNASANEMVENILERMALMESCNLNDNAQLKPQGNFLYAF